MLVLKVLKYSQLLTFQSQESNTETRRQVCTNIAGCNKTQPAIDNSTPLTKYYH